VTLKIINYIYRYNTDWTQGDLDIFEALAERTRIPTTEKGVHDEFFLENVCEDAITRPDSRQTVEKPTDKSSPQDTELLFSEGSGQSGYHKRANLVCDNFRCFKRGQEACNIRYDKVVVDNLVNG
jgi:hypothetical protein